MAQLIGALTEMSPAPAPAVPVVWMVTLVPPAKAEEMLDARIVEFVVGA